MPFTSFKDSAIIVHKKFKQFIKSLNLDQENTIIPISMEMHDYEINAIRGAIRKYEKKAFLDFIYSKK